MKLGITAIALAISTVLIGTAALSAHAQTAATVTSGNTTTTVASAPGKVKAVQTTKMTATVLSINMSSREVTLMDMNGKLHPIDVSEDARTLDQVRVGDQVTVEYTEAISLTLKKKGTNAPPASAEEAMMRSPKGAKPGGAVGRQVTAIASVVAVDAKKQIVTLRGPLGNEYDLSVQDPSQLKEIRTGDQVEVTYTEALAISVKSTPQSQSKEKSQLP